MVMTVDCPSCATSFPVDPAKVPEAGVSARCTVCAEVFRVERPSDDAADAGAPDSPVAAPEPEIAGPAPDGGWDSVGSDSYEDEDEDEGWDAGGSDVGTETAEFDTGAFDAPEDGDDDDWVVETEDAADASDDFFGAAGHEDVAEEPAMDEEEDEDASFEVGGMGLGGDDPAATEEAPAEAAGDDAPVQGFSFEERDPSDKARRLARVLVSDMIMYNPERHQRALENGTLTDDFEEEISKSWKEYVDQVGEEMAESTDYWTEALNDILAKGEQVF